MFDLIEYLIKQGIPHTVSDDGRITVGGDLDLRCTRITALPDGLTVGGYLDLSYTGITTLPEKFTYRSLYLDPERISNVAYRTECGSLGRTIFEACTGKEIRIAARCFFDPLDAFERAVDIEYTGKAADDYKQSRLRGNVWPNFLKSSVNEDNKMIELNPCPFCKSGETYVSPNRCAAGIHSYTLNHYCDLIRGNITFTGISEEEVKSFWNCEGERNDKGKIEGIKIAANYPEIPEGCVVVPLVPTTEIIAAAMNSIDVTFDDDDYIFVHHDTIYAAMLAAAPKFGGCK